VAISIVLRDRREHGNDDRRNLAELNHGEHEQPPLASKEPLAARPRIRATVVRTTNRTID
jgi:hypothetical protein